MTTPSSERIPLWRDVRVLKWIFQVVVVVIALAVIWWLYGNYTSNSSRQNIPTNFDFLDNPASFQITDNPLSQRAPVRSALVQGLINTLRVAIAGIVLASVLGTLIGIARLSRNWLLSKMAATYVEAVRNIPLAIFLFVGYLAIVLGLFPTIADAWTPAGVAVISNRGIAVPWFVGSGYGLLGLGAIAGAAAWLVARWRHRVSDRTGALPRTGMWALGVFGLVLVVGWLTLGYELTLPTVEGRQSVGGMRVDPSFFALLFALVVYTASHIAEIVRGSIQAVPLGQGEAANALALSGFQRMWFVVLPQAFRIALPPVGNQYLNLIKNSSLGAAIGYYDLTLVTQTAVGNGAPAVPSFTLAMAVYILIALATSALVNTANRRLALVDR